MVFAVAGSLTFFWLDLPIHGVMDRRVANIYFTLVAALSTTSLSPVRQGHDWLGTSPGHYSSKHNEMNPVLFAWCTA